MRTILYASKYFSFLIGATGEEFVQCGDEVMIVALTADHQVIFTIEPSAAFGEPVLILPGGQVEPNEPLHETANRELQEEIGFRAARIDFLGKLRPFSKYLSTESHIFLGRDLTPSPLPGDEQYTIGLERHTLGNVDDLINAQRLQDARVIAALCLARHFLAGEQTSSKQS
jgi:ADP-ribose diphosphatase